MPYTRMPCAAFEALFFFCSSKAVQFSTCQMPQMPSWWPAQRPCCCACLLLQTVELFVAALHVWADLHRPVLMLCVIDIAVPGF